jgi:glycosyltransferase involved in cell wall biosynthesis
MLSLAKGLAEAGCAVRIFCLGPVGKRNRGEISGEIDGIAYTHLGGRTGFYASTLPGKAIHFFASMMDGLQVFKKKNRPDAVLLLSIRLIHLFPYLRAAGRHSIPVFHERNEYPHRNVRTITDRILLQLYLEKVVPRFAGLALMTKALIKYFSENCSRCPPMLHLPMTVDPARFLAESVSPVSDRYIAHCGSSFGDKDGVPVLVGAFAQIAPLFPDVKLVLIGSDPDCYATERLQQQIHDLGMQERIILTGQIARDEMPAWLSHAEVLALARPANLQAAGGFPTKLGEYLSSARPVVVTRVGEIPEYLQDGVNAWLAEPGSVDSFADKLREVLTLDKEERNAMGLRGRDVALSVFNFSVQGRRFAGFIQDQIKNCRVGQI